MSLDRLFQALGDPTRLRLLNLLSEGELCVCYFVEILDEPQPKISRHLAYLRDAGLVSARREGKWMHYRLTRPADAGAAAIVDAVLEVLWADRTMQRERAALRNACCAVRLPKGLRDAPRPVLGTNQRASAAPHRSGGT
jgi:ArsR family transcriptional regulator